MTTKNLQRVLWAGALVVAVGCYENFGEPVRITPDADTDVVPLGISTDGNDNLYAVYEARFRDRHHLALRTSTDAGETWDSYQGLHDEESAFADEAWIMGDRYQADYLYVLQENAGLLKSTDTGNTWATFAPADGALNSFSGMTQKPLSGHIIITGLDRFDRGPSLVKTYDRGDTWGPVLDLPFGGGGPALEWVQDILYTTNATLVLLTTELRSLGQDVGWHSWIYRSNDDGETWSGRTSLEWHPATLAYDMSTGALIMDEGVLYALVGGRNVTAHRSIDHGVTWSEPDVLYQETNSIGAGGVVVMGAGILTDDVVAAWNEGFETGTPAPGDEMNIYYQVLTDSLWTEKRRMNNHYRAVIDFGGMASHGDEMVALWTDDRFQSVSGPELVACKNTDDQTVIVSAQFDESSFDLELGRGDLVELDYKVADWACEFDSIADVWLTYRGENGISGTLELHEDVALPCRTEIGLSWVGNVHPRTPYQDYNVTVWVGDFPGEIQDRDTHTVTVAP